MNDLTKEKVLKLLEGIPVERQIKILKAAKIMALMRADQAKDDSTACERRKQSDGQSGLG